MVREKEHISMIQENPDGTKTPLTIPNHSRINASVLKKFLGKKFLGEIKRNQRKLNSNHTLLPHIKIYTK